jgi:hypothetical protein
MISAAEGSAGPVKLHVRLERGLTQCTLECEI